jgi:hypothetical protein
MLYSQNKTKAGDFQLSRIHWTAKSCSSDTSTLAPMRLWSACSPFRYRRSQRLSSFDPLSTEMPQLARRTSVSHQAGRPRDTGLHVYRLSRVSLVSLVFRFAPYSAVFFDTLFHVAYDLPSIFHLSSRIILCSTFLVVRVRIRLCLPW